MTSLDSFRIAVSKPSLSGVVVTLVVAGIQLLLVGWTVTPEFIVAQPPEALMSGPRDHDALVTHAAQTLRLGEPSTLSVTLVGNSAFREAFSSEEAIEEALAKELGRSVEVYDLTVGGMRAWDVATLSDAMPDDYRGVVVMSTTAVADPALIRERLEAPRFAVSSAAFDDETRLAGFDPRPRTGVYVADFSSFFLPRASAMARAWLSGPVEPLRHMYLGRTMGTEYREMMVSRLTERAGDYREYRDEHYAAVRRNIDRFAGATVVWLQPPVNEAIVEPIYGQALIDEMSRDRASLASEIGVELWNLDQDARLAGEDFFDYCHLNNDDAMGRYTNVLVRNLARVLNGLAEGQRG